MIRQTDLSERALTNSVEDLVLCRCRKPLQVDLLNEHESLPYPLSSSYQDLPQGGFFCSHRFAATCLVKRVRLLSLLLLLLLLLLSNPQCSGMASMKIQYFKYSFWQLPPELLSQMYCGMQDKVQVLVALHICTVWHNLSYTIVSC